ncbi:MAG: hypothetical protein HEP71_02465 [Roseivirga sp.]|nr:hypothetical protein [Roseivirga sp.]
MIYKIDEKVLSDISKHGRFQIESDKLKQIENEYFVSESSFRTKLESLFIDDQSIDYLVSIAGVKQSIEFEIKTTELKKLNDEVKNAPRTRKFDRWIKIITAIGGVGLGAISAIIAFDQHRNFDTEKQGRDADKLVFEKQLDSLKNIKASRTAEVEKLDETIENLNLELKLEAFRLDSVRLTQQVQISSLNLTKTNLQGQIDEQNRALTEKEKRISKAGATIDSLELRKDSVIQSIIDVRNRLLEDVGRLSREVKRLNKNTDSLLDKIGIDITYEVDNTNKVTRDKRPFYRIGISCEFQNLTNELIESITYSFTDGLKSVRIEDWSVPYYLRAYKSFNVTVIVLLKDGSTIWEMRKIPINGS